VARICKWWLLCRGHTKKILHGLEKEWSSHDYFTMNIDTVVYAGPEFSIAKEFPEILDACKQFLTEILEDKEEQPIFHGWEAFIARATTLKHEGFQEEREIRIMCSPWTPKLDEEARRRDSSMVAKERNYKTIKWRHSGFRAIPYIELFQGLDWRLPIKRVIVGPSRDQQRNYHLARGIVGTNLPVTCSRTPFIG
jgi:hypothetical protein